jgi:hypothetical protein
MLLIVVAYSRITVCWNLLLLIKQILKLSENNSFKIENTVDKTAEVYLSIPSEKQEKESAN